jgi:hypothetical protein
LYIRAATEQRLHVVILLSYQPQGDIVRRTEESWEAEKRAASDRLHEMLSTPFSTDQDVRAASAELDRIVVGVRGQAMREIRSAIQRQQQDVTLLLRSRGATSIRSLAVVSAITAEVPSSVLSALDADPEIAEVFPAARFHRDLYVSVPAILAPTFWSACSKGVGESVGVLDSGVMVSNPGFDGVTITSQVFLSQGSSDPCFGDDLTPNDNLGHGTHVAGIVASQGAGSCPTCIGTAPAVHLYNLKVGWVVKSGNGCPGGGEADSQDVLDAIDWAVGNTPVGVFNFSYGGPATGDDDGMSQAFDQIEDAWGINIAIAAGNGGSNSMTVESPGISYNGVTAASMDDQNTVDRSDDVISSFSSRGPTVGGRDKPDISAPGCHISSEGLGIESTYINGDYARLCGTSMATPHVAGSLALIRSAGTADGIAAKAILLNTAYNTSPTWGDAAGWGFVDLSEASSQVNNYLLASISAGQPMLYGGIASGALRSTLVWNREVTAACTPTNCPASNLDLYMYDGAGGSMLSSSTSTVNNVEQVAATADGPTVLEVVPVALASGVATEPYALAVSSAGFTAKNGPSLGVSCTGPSGSVAVNTSFTVPCAVTNSGDLTAFSVQGTLSWQGSPGATPQQFGSLTSGQQSAAQSFQVAAPSAAGAYTLQAAVSSSSYGLTFAGSTTVCVAVSMTVAQSCYSLTLSVSPSGAGAVSASPSSAGGLYAVGTQVCLSATPNPGWAFDSWSGATLDSNNCLTINGSVSVTANFVSVGALRFVPVPPCRVVDTRNASGPLGGPAIASGSSRSFIIPNGSCGIPSSAAAYSLNAAMIPGGKGWITIWPTGQSQPGTASVNSPDGRVKSSGVIVQAGTGGAISVYASPSTVSTNVALDVNGYFVPASGNPTALQFYPLTPCRVADTRNATGPLGGPFMPAGSTRVFPVFSATSCNIPSTAQAFSFNITVIPQASRMRWLTAWPSNVTQPVVASLDDPPGVTLSNGLIVPAPTDNSGDVSIYVTDGTQVVIDINGYFAPPGSGGLSLYTVVPCRALDTRSSGSPFTGTLAVDVVDSGCGAAGTAQDYIFNATLIPESPHGYLTLWEQGQTMPVAANVTVSDGRNTGNMALVSTDNGSINAYFNSSTYLVLDLFGYFAP